MLPPCEHLAALSSWPFSQVSQVEEVSTRRRRRHLSDVASRHYEPTSGPPQNPLSTHLRSRRWPQTDLSRFVGECSPSKTLTSAREIDTRPDFEQTSPSQATTAFHDRLSISETSSRSAHERASIFHKLTCQIGDFSFGRRSATWLKFHTNPSRFGGMQKSHSSLANLVSLIAVISTLCLYSSQALEIKNHQQQQQLRPQITNITNNSTNTHLHHHVLRLSAEQRLKRHHEQANDDYSEPPAATLYEDEESEDAAVASESPGDLLHGTRQPTPALGSSPDLPTQQDTSAVVAASESITTTSDDQSGLVGNTSVAKVDVTTTTTTEVPDTLLASLFSHIDKQWKFAEIILIIVSSVILNLVTIIGNIMVLISFKMDRSLQTVSNYFLLSLALADLLIGLISMPLYTLYLLLNYWPLGPLMCDIWLAIDYLNSNAAVLNMLIISFDRYFSVTRPLTYRAKRTTKHACLMISCAWILSLTIWTPAIFTYPYYKGRTVQGTDKCEIEFVKANTYLTFVTAILAFYIPVIIMIYLYWRIWLETKKRYRDLTTLFLVSAVGAAAPARSNRTHLGHQNNNSSFKSRQQQQQQHRQIQSKPPQLAIMPPPQPLQPQFQLQNDAKINQQQVASPFNPRIPSNSELEMNNLRDSPKVDPNYLSPKTAKAGGSRCRCPCCPRKLSSSNKPQARHLDAHERGRKTSKDHVNSMSNCEACKNLCASNAERPLYTVGCLMCEARNQRPTTCPICINVASQRQTLQLKNQPKNRHNHNHHHHHHGHHHGHRKCHNHHHKGERRNLCIPTPVPSQLQANSGPREANGLSLITSSYHLLTSNNQLNKCVGHKVHPDFQVDQDNKSLASDDSERVSSGDSPVLANQQEHLNDERPLSGFVETRDIATSPIKLPSEFADDDEDEDRDLETRIVSCGDQVGFRFESDQISACKSCSVGSTIKSKCCKITPTLIDSMQSVPGNPLDCPDCIKSANIRSLHQSRQHHHGHRHHHHNHNHNHHSHHNNLHHHRHKGHGHGHKHHHHHHHHHHHGHKRNKHQEGERQTETMGRDSDIRMSVGSNVDEPLINNEKLPILRALEDDQQQIETDTTRQHKSGWPPSQFNGLTMTKTKSAELKSEQSSDTLSLKKTNNGPKKLSQKLTFSDILVESRAEQSQGGHDSRDKVQGSSSAGDVAFAERILSLITNFLTSFRSLVCCLCLCSNVNEKQKMNAVEDGRLVDTSLDNTRSGEKLGFLGCCRRRANGRCSQRGDSLYRQRNSSTTDESNDQQQVSGGRSINGHSGSTQKPSYSSHHPIQPKSERKAAKTLSTLLLVFIVTWLPYNILVLIKTLSGGEDQVPEKIWNFSYYLCYINSTINPLCYALCNAQFRRTYMRILKCKLSNEHNSSRRLVPLQSSTTWNKDLTQRSGTSSSNSGGFRQTTIQNQAEANSLSKTSLAKRSK